VAHQALDHGKTFFHDLRTETKSSNEDFLLL
jgi:hypothetical protein